MNGFIVILLSAASATQFMVRPMDPKSLGDATHKTGDTMGEDWGQEYGPKQFQWRKEEPTHEMDAFDKNLARDANSPLDKKHPLPGSPGAAPAAAVLAGAPMDPTMLDPHGTMHKNGDTQAADWGQEYGPKQFQWNKDKIKEGLDDFDRNIVR